MLPLPIVDTVAYHPAAGLAIRYRITIGRAALADSSKGDAWVAAGFAELARSGVDGVRVEVLAKNLGVTKGGFYRRFRDRAALLDGMLQSWSAGRISAIEAQTSLDGANARERLKALIRLYSERMNTEGMAVELAIRQWARTDDAAAAAVAAVDAARLKNVGQLYRATASAPRTPMRRRFCSTVLSSARACCFPSGPAQARATGGEVSRKAD